MSSGDSETPLSQVLAMLSAFRPSSADKIRRNDKSLTQVNINNWDDAIEILDALRNNTVVKNVTILETDNLLQVNQEAFVKLFEVMNCNRSVESLTVYLQRGLLRERFFATMATNGWSSIRELVLYDPYGYMSLREPEYISSFILQSDNLRTFQLVASGDENVTIIETLPRTKVESLEIHFQSAFSLQNGGRRLATALQRCTSITELKLDFPSYNDQVEFFQILLVESIPKMLGLKKLELETGCHYDQGFFDMVGRCIGGHQGEIEEMRLVFSLSSVNISIVGLAPALRRLKVIRFTAPLTSQQFGELSDVAADCETLEEFSSRNSQSSDDFKAFCQLCSSFPSLKRVSQHHGQDLREVGRFTAFLEMVRTSKTIEQIPSLHCNIAEGEAAIRQHCRNNMMHNRIKLIRQKGLLTAKVPSCAWPLILQEFSDMPDVLYYLLHQKHGAMIGPTCD